MPHRSDFGTPYCLRPTEAGWSYYFDTGMISRLKA